MNAKKIALGGFSHVKDEELLMRGNTVLTAMTVNLHFPEPRPSLEVTKILVLDFQEKLAVCRRKGSPHDTAAKNEAKVTLVGALQELAFYVSKTAAGDLKKLLSSGFELSSEMKPVEAPEVVTGVQLRDGKQNGQMRLDFDKQSRVLMYEYRYALEEYGYPGNWSDPLLTTSSRNNVLAPLQSLQRYYVQVRGVNGYGRSEWSEAVSHIPR